MQGVPASAFSLFGFMDPYLMRRLTIGLLVMLISTALILLRVKHSQVFKSVERQIEFEQQIKSGVAYSSDPKVHFQDGMTYVNVGDYEDAELSFQQAIELKPDWAEAHFYLGFVYTKLGYRDKALEEYEILQKLDKKMAQKLSDLISEGKR